MDDLPDTEHEGRVCAACGHPASPGDAFCTSCGRSIAPPTWTPPVEEPVGPPARDPHRTRVVRVVLLLLTLVVVAAFLVVRATRGDDSDTATDEAGAGETSSPPSSTPTTSPTPSPTPSQTPSPTPSPSPSEAESPSAAGASRARCWDGSRADRVADCTAPEGLEGLAWVYPTLALQDCADPDTSADVTGRVLLVKCTDRLADGTEVTISYSQWASVADGLAHFDGEGIPHTVVRDDGGVPVVHQWSGQVGQLYELAGLYADEPYSAAVFVPKEDQLDDTAGVATARPPDQVRGETVGSG